MSRWMLVLLALLAVSTSARCQTVRVEGGEISGVTAKTGATAYKGVPYAAPPVNALRWRAPEAVVPWTGVRKADQLPPMCMQRDGDVKGAFYWGDTPTSEDCLYLNVWTPAKSASAHLPVMVWIHGGAFQVGYGGSKFIDGEGLATQGVLLVTINYRLNVFGFLAHPALSQESEHHVSGNYGTLDQIAALRWVQKNIAAFGGDPRNVTLFGQSAGAASVCNVMASPLAKGLFVRVIGESMGCFGAMPKLANAEQAGTKYAAAANAVSVADLREIRRGLAEHQGGISVSSGGGRLRLAQGNRGEFPRRRTEPGSRHRRLKLGRRNRAGHAAGVRRRFRGHGETSI